MTGQENVRELALAVLLEVERGEKSHLILRQILEKYQYLDKRERAFLTRLAEGTIERRLELDYLLNQVSRVRTEKMKPVIRNLLRMGAYQIKYMEGVPDAAAVNETVKLAVRKGFGSLRGFVNGVLRNFARSWRELPYPPEDTADGLSVRFSMPLWIVERFLADYGWEQTRQILESVYQVRPTVIRVNESRTTKEALLEELRAEGVTAAEHPEVSSALMISGYDYLGALTSFRAGKFQVQDAASIQAVEQAGIRPGDFVLDVCAAPGGKALLAAQLAGEEGRVQARDLTAGKVALIAENITRMGAETVEVVQWDAIQYDPSMEGRADVVLADLPCSGLGVLDKKTDLKYRITPADVEELTKLQRQILETVQRYVRPGGRLVYSTCTVSRRENEENARWFAAEFPAFHLEWERQIFPGPVTDGFYIARFQKER